MFGRVNEFGEGVGKGDARVTEARPLGEGVVGLLFFGAFVVVFEIGGGIVIDNDL